MIRKPVPNGKLTDCEKYAFDTLLLVKVVKFARSQAEITLTNSDAACN